MARPILLRFMEVDPSNQTVKMFESVQKAALQLLSPPLLVHSGIVSATTCLRDLVEVYTVSTSNDDVKDEVKLNAMVATLREFRALRDQLRPILGAAETLFEALQEICLPHIRKCGINSLPDELIRRIFEVTCGPHDVSLPYFDIPMDLSHVCRRFRSVALHAPPIWTKLCNLQSVIHLETYMERSKADLSIWIISSSLKGFHADLIPGFLDFVIKHSKRWSFIHYRAPNRYDWPRDDEPPELPYTHPTLLDYPNLDLPRLTSMVCTKPNYKRSKDLLHVIPYAVWNMPNLVQFKGFNVMADIPSLGSNLRSCELKFHSEDDGAWDLDDFLRAMESSTMLQSLTLEISHADSSGSKDHFPPKISLISLRTFDLCLNYNVDSNSVLQLLSSLIMPVLTQITVTFGFENDRIEAIRVFNEIVSFAARCPLLEKFTFKYASGSYLSMANRGLLDTLAWEFPHLREVNVMGPAFCSTIFNSRCIKKLAWRVLRVEDCSERDYRVLLKLAEDMKEAGRLGELEIRLKKPRRSTSFSTS